ncbi:MAG: hypothetical protein NTV63_03285 [Candidatus Woesearchaeota archaeon]|nr:hypothetical protein [Candidatus Woesearchaeota archaeon]
MSNLFEFDFSGISVLPDKRDVIVRIRAKPNDRVNSPDGKEESIENFLEGFYKKAEYYIKPKGVYSLESIRQLENRLYFSEKNIFVESILLAEKFANQDSAVVFAVTIGRMLEDYSQKLSEEGKILESLIYDAIGSESADCAVEIMHEALSPKNLPEKRRYSPGYPGWDLSEQKNIFDIIGREEAEEIAGITLNDSFYMSPRKSVSGIIMVQKK